MSKDVTVSVDQENKNVIVKGLKTSELLIDYSNDIDFSELMSELTDLIGSSEIITLTIEEYDATDDKLKIIVETTNSIFEKYSESINAINIEDDDLPF